MARQRRRAGARAEGPPRSASALLAIAVLGATASLAPGSSSASTPAGLRAEATALSSQIAQDSQQLQSIGEQYLTLANRYRLDVADEHSESSLLAADRSAARYERHRLVNAAVEAYVGSGSESSVGLYLDSEPDEIVSDNAYLDVATSTLQDSLDAYESDVQKESGALSALAVATNQAASALAGKSAARQQAVTTLAAERSSLSSVSGQLATLVAQEAAAAELKAEKAAQAAAARAAVLAAAEAATSTTTAPVVADSGTTSTTTPASIPTIASAGPPSAAAVSASSTEPPTSLTASFLAIRECESSDDYQLNTGNGYYGAYQFSQATWNGLGGSGLPSAAAPADQDAAAYKLYQTSGWASWPSCAAIAGLS